MHCRLLHEDAQTPGPSPNYMSSTDPITIVHFSSSPPPLVPHSSVCLVLSETKPPGHMRGLLQSLL